MTNIYRKIFYSFFIVLILVLIIVTIIVKVVDNNVVATVILSFIIIYLGNAILALWISTSSVRMTHTKLAWLLSFLVFPIISGVIYLIWGRMPYYAKSVVDFEKEYEEYLKYYGDANYPITSNSNSFDIIAKYIHSLRKSTIFSNNKIDVIHNNIDFYSNILNNIDKAKQTIFMCYYIIDDGQFYQSVKQKLIEKANQGIKIYLLFDRYGSTKKFTPKMLLELQKYKNIYIAKFESDRDVWTRSANNFRSHKKCLIIDNKIVIYGGSNLADEYLSIKHNSPNWNDLNYVISGPIVKSFLIDYAIDWDFNSFLPFNWQLGDYFHCNPRWKTLYFIKFYLSNLRHYKEIIPILKNRKHPKKILHLMNQLGYLKNDYNDQSEVNNSNKAILFPTGPRYYNNIVSDTLLTAFMNAKKSVKIISPYLQLNDTLCSALISIKQRGVDVHLITAGSCDDKWFLLDMNRSIYSKLVNFGIKIYEYSGFIHTKLIIIDDEYILTGTFNMDYRSFNSNFETMMAIQNSECLKNVIIYFDECLKYSEECDKYKIYKHQSLRSVFVQTGLQIIQPLL